MRLRLLILIQAVCLAALGVEEVVRMEPLRARVSNIAFRCLCVADTDKIAEIGVVEVAANSGADKAGLRAGDQLVAIDGLPVVGRRRSDIITPAGLVAVRGHEVSFTGRRGFLRRKWSLTATIDARGNLEAKPPAPKPGPTPEGTAHR